MKTLLSTLTLILALGFAVPAFAGDVTTAKNAADCEKAGGTWDAAKNVCSREKDVGELICLLFDFRASASVGALFCLGLAFLHAVHGRLGFCLGFIFSHHFHARRHAGDNRTLFRCGIEAHIPLTGLRKSGCDESTDQGCSDKIFLHRVLLEVRLLRLPYKRRITHSRSCKTRNKKPKRLTAFLDHPRLLPESNELSRPTLHRLIISAACAREVGRESNDFFYMPVGVIPELDPIREIIVAPASWLGQTDPGQ